MRINKFISAIAAASLLATSTIAAAAPTGSALSVAAGKQVRKSTTIGKHSKLEGGIDSTVLIIFVLLAIGVFIAASGNGEPNSP